MSRKNFPLFPVPPFSGDDYTPPHRGNTGVGVYEIALLTMMHALVTRGKESNLQSIVNEADALANLFMQKIILK